MARFGILDDVAETLEQWMPLLRKLTFTENIDGNVFDVELEAGEVRGISHGLGGIPSGFVVLDAFESNSIVRDDQIWDTNFAYIKNKASTSTFTGKVAILR